jgi:hypothetical protein
MVARVVMVVVSAAFIFAVASCNDRRPEEADTKAEFMRLYPTAEM